MTRSAGLIRLRPDSRVVIRDNGHVVVSAPGARAIRTTRAAIPVIRLLHDGISNDDLQNVLAQQQQRAALDSFLDVLAAADLLADTARGERKFALQFDIDPAARFMATIVCAIPPLIRGMAALALVLLSVAGIALLTWLHRQPHVSFVVQQTDIVAVVCALLILVPFHEFAHAVACRCVGVRVSAAGFGYGPTLLGAHVDTTGIYAVQSRWKRAAVPGAGPLMDLCIAGTGAWLTILVPLGLPHFATYLTLIASCAFTADLNPFRSSDGAHALEALFNDEMLRRRAVSLAPLRSGSLTRPGVVRRFRIACVAYVFMVAGVVCWLGHLTPVFQ